MCLHGKFVYKHPNMFKVYFEITISVLSGYLWFSFYKQRIRINYALKKLNFTNTLMYFKSFNYNHTINVGVAYICLSFFIYSISVSLLNFGRNLKSKWTFSYKLKNGTQSDVALFIATFFYNLQPLFLPCLLNFVLCVFFFNCSYVLKKYARTFKRLENRKVSIRLIRAYSQLTKTIEQLSEILSTPSFLSSAIFFMKTFNCFRIALSNRRS